MESQWPVRNPQAHGERFTSRRACVGIVLRNHTAFAGVNLWTMLGYCFLALGLKLFKGAKAAVGLALVQQAVRVLAINFQPFRLPIRRVRAADFRAFVPVKTEPA